MDIKYDYKRKTWSLWYMGEEYGEYHNAVTAGAVAEDILTSKMDDRWKGSAIYPVGDGDWIGPGHHW